MPSLESNQPIAKRMSTSCPCICFRSGPSTSSSSCCTLPAPSVLAVRLTLLLLFIACCVLGIYFFEELKDHFLDVLAYISQIGFWRGSLVLCAANIVGALLFMPCLPFTLGAGFLYGTVKGSIIVSIASTIAAVLAFLCARYLARKWIEKSLGGRGSKFRILDNAINQDGFRIVFLIRSSPIHPYGVCNYLFGLTAIPVRDYTVASFVGMLPATIMEVYFGTAMNQITDIINGQLEHNLLSRVFFWSGLVVSVVITISITVLLKRKLRDEMEKYRLECMQAGEISDVELASDTDLLHPHPSSSTGSSSSSGSSNNASSTSSSAPGALSVMLGLGGGGGGGDDNARKSRSNDTRRQKTPTHAQHNDAQRGAFHHTINTSSSSSGIGGSSGIGNTLPSGSVGSLSLSPSPPSPGGHHSGLSEDDVFTEPADESDGLLLSDKKA